MVSAPALLAKLRFLRGTAFDVFGYSDERSTERALIGDYEKLIDELLGKLDAGNHALAIELASIPEEIRGYGHVKSRHLQTARARQAELLARRRGHGNAQVIRMPVKAA